MFWKFAKTTSISNRVLIIFIASTALILSAITLLVYPPMKELLYQSRLHHQHYHYLLTKICIKKFFIALWCCTAIVIVAGYLLAKKSLNPIKLFTAELASINALSLNKRLADGSYPLELQELALTCNSMLFRIECAFSSIKQFSASMAHELRNPIHYLQNATEITLAKPQTNAAYQQLLQQHLQEYEALTGLIDNLLFLTRCEQRQLPLTINAISAKELIHSVIDYYESFSEELEITILVTGDAQIEVDEHLFKRVISNLIDNGLAYTPKGGLLSITIESLASNPIQIALQDNGIGIAEKDLPLLCRGFYRVNKESNKQNAGLGLGLAIAKSIMELHRGQLTISSRLGEGTRVTLTLPNEVILDNT